jgi:hypothetical protein
MNRTPKPPPDWMKLGVDVEYEEIVGEGVTHRGTIRHEPWLMGGHSWMVMITGKAGGVSCDHVRRAAP